MDSSLAAALQGDAPLLTFAVLAEFDIDRGNVVRASAPAEWPLEQHREYLAEQMLPDRSEGYPSMWTVFFLNRPSPSSNPSSPVVASALGSDSLRCFVFKLRSGADPAVGSSWSRMGSEEAGEELWFVPGETRAAASELYVYSSAPSPGKRGGCLGSMPVGGDLVASRAPPPVDAQAPGGAGVPQAFVRLDLSGVTWGVVCSSTDAARLLQWPLCAAAGEGERAPCEDDGMQKEGPEPFTYCLCRFRSERVEGVRRGAVMKSVAVGTTNPTFWQCFAPLVGECLAECLSHLEGDEPVRQTECLNELVEVANSRVRSALESAQRVTPSRWRVWTGTLGQPTRMFHRTTATYRGKDFTIAVPLHAPAEELSGDLASVRRLLEVFGENTLAIIEAILCERRVLFVAGQRAAEEVCSCVLAAAAAVAPPSSGLLTGGRVFPYSSLTCMHIWQAIPGCIVGVTNPVFQARAEWWDVLCDIDTGRVQFSPACEGLGEVPASDVTFVQRTLTAVTQQLRRKEPADIIENWVRHSLREWVFTLFATCRESPLEPTSADPALARVARVSRCAAFHRWCGSRRRKKGVDVEGNLRRLRGAQELSEEDALLIYQDFVKHLRTEDQLLGLLEALPLAADGLYPLALGLFHRSEAVQMACVALLRRIDGFAEGRLCISALNAYMMLAYERAAELMPATDSAPFPLSP
eukprot:Hpha_TRINITY_DN3043_c0_g1::TRINITY_DN3043_c0_g1_i1::g.138606::m.138606